MKTNINKHAQAVPASVIEALENATDSSITEIQPYAVVLTAQDRNTMAKMGDKTVAFVEKSHEYASKNPALCPSYFNMEAFSRDFDDAHNLWVLRNKAKQFYEILDNIVVVAGSEAYQWARLFYQSVKMAKDQGIPGAQAIYEELKKRFPYGTRHTPDMDTETFTDPVSRKNQTPE